MLTAGEGEHIGSHWQQGSSDHAGARRPPRAHRRQEVDALAVGVAQTGFVGRVVWVVADRVQCALVDRPCAAKMTEGGGVCVWCGVGGTSVRRGKPAAELRESPRDCRMHARTHQRACPASTHARYLCSHSGSIDSCSRSCSRGSCWCGFSESAHARLPREDSCHSPHPEPQRRRTKGLRS